MVLFKNHPAVPDVHRDPVPVSDGPLEDFDRKGVLDQVLNGPLEGPGAVSRVEPCVRQKVLCPFGQIERDLALFESFPEEPDLNAHNLLDLFVTE